MKNIALNTVWRAERAKNIQIKPHTHNFYELVYYAQGRGRGTVGEKEYRFESDSFIIIPPDTCHSEQHFAKADVICLSFTAKAEFEEDIYSDTTGEIKELLNKLLSEAANQHYGYREMMTAIITELLISIKRNRHLKQSSSKDFKYIINYIKENYHEKIKLTDCAEQLNISYDYFRHKFKEITGLSPQELLLEQRLNASKKALKEGMNCTEAAYRCGFSTSAQFSMLFKNKFGISPVAYKKQKNGL